jgi:UDP-GlcNAc:undecaprenyl-phosphate GlcNAc-1-phosphate transferase
VSFPLNVYACALVSALVTTLAALPAWRAWCLRKGLVDDPGHRKIHAKPVPLAGGLAVMTGLLIPTVLACIFLCWEKENAGQASGAGLSAWLLRYGLSRRALELAGILSGAAGMLALGWLDDRHDLSPKWKFAGQVIVASTVAALGVRITLFVPSAVFSYAVTVLWVVTVINAFNFMDNMNGLCAGVAVIGAWYFAMLAAADGQYLVALLAFLTVGSLLGFLPYNFPRARAFLGDAGSHLLGYLLAILAILPHFYTGTRPRPVAVLAPLFVLGVPLLDLVRVVILRLRAGKPFYQGDTNHLSHWLVRSGFTPSQAVTLIWLAAAALGALTFLFV